MRGCEPSLAIERHGQVATKSEDIRCIALHYRHTFIHIVNNHAAFRSQTSVLLSDLFVVWQR
jgi:hypothetical protein